MKRILFALSFAIPFVAFTKDVKKNYRQAAWGWLHTTHDLLKLMHDFHPKDQVLKAIFNRNVKLLSTLKIDLTPNRHHVIAVPRDDFEKIEPFANYYSKIPPIGSEYDWANFSGTYLAFVLLRSLDDKTEHERECSRQMLQIMLNVDPHPDLLHWTVSFRQGMVGKLFMPVIALAVDRSDLLGMLLGTRTEPLPVELRNLLADLTYDRNSTSLLTGLSLMMPLQKPFIELQITEEKQAIKQHHLRDVIYDTIFGWIAGGVASSLYGNNFFTGAGYGLPAGLGLGFLRAYLRTKTACKEIDKKWAAKFPQLLSKNKFIVW